jgi:pimeloyl-ACP methyl ester carboxylesterase
MALRMFAQMGVRRYAQTWAKMLADDPLREISAVTAPCLVVRGERDAIIPRAAAHQLAALLPRGVVLGVAGAGHVVQFNHAGAFTQILLAFLEGTEAVGGRWGPPDLRERGDEPDHHYKVAGAAA